MKALIIQHTEATPPGSTIDWLEQKNIPFTIYFFSSLQPLNLDEYDFVFICGGGMNVDQEEQFPWLSEEKKFIKEIIRKNKKIVGLCLGAQLLAECLGGKVFKAPHWEAGWQNVKLNDGEILRAFEWHGYQFISPPGAVVTAANIACAHQAFTHGKNIMAFQFHPESSKEWIIERANDLDRPEKSTYVQSKDEMLNEIELQRQLQQWYFRQLDQFI